VSLAAPPGTCLAILGPNGSGKSTLLQILGAALRPGRGHVRIFGEDPFTAPAVRGKIGLTGHEPMLYGGLSVIENLRLLAVLYRLDDGNARVGRICDLLGIDRPTTPVRRLSRGMQQRAALARALLHGPAVLLLDEPFTGLDPGGVADLRRILREFCRNGGAIILTTHGPAEAISVADQAAMLAMGRLSPPRPLEGVTDEALGTWYAGAAEGAGR
jgi:ABC-type multidrug transport system ATPase subunit